MFNREIKKQFNESKYKLLTRKNNDQRVYVTFVNHHKSLIGFTVAIIGAWAMARRYYELPHVHKDTTKPMLLTNGELHPYEVQPASAKGMKEYTNMG